MPSKFHPPLILAPLQGVMLRDSLMAPDSGHHVEQVEIRFAPSVNPDRIALAWEKTVAAIDALRIAFVVEDGVPAGMELVEPAHLLVQETSVPEPWDPWLEMDRKRPLLAPHTVPWRAAFWPRDRRFVCTFHHALLDGRSIARVVRHFLQRVDGRNPPPLALAEWHAPTPRTVDLATAMFDQAFAGLEPIDPGLPTVPATSPAIFRMGAEFAGRVEALAAAAEVTAPTVLIWAWSQALAKLSGADAVFVEQLRSGAPQDGTAGFTMNTLPLVIPRASVGDLKNSLRDLRSSLLALRAIESVSPLDFPPGVYPNTAGPGKSVIMIERGTFRHQVGPVAETGLVESMVLHERPGDSLLATAYLQPDLQLGVEGPGANDLLNEWIGVLRGVDVGLPFKGHAPDLGAFESGTTR